MIWGIWHWLERRADLHPNRPALVDQGQPTTFRRLRDRVAAFAGAMRERGVRRGDRVAVLSINRAEYVEVLFAAARLGAIVVPLNWRLTPPELAFQVGDSEPVLLLLDPELRQLAEGVRERPEAKAIRGVVAFDGGAIPGWAEPYDALLRANPAAPEGRFEMAASGITVKAVCPGYVRTPLVEKQIADQARVHGIPAAEVVERIMLGPQAVRRLLEPEEVAAMVVYLCSEAAGGVTGAALPIDAGWTAH